ncbi:unnamed protein product [Anisakis simplex]|uniref:ShKT domain-containing protein n=1 Tax=Anisakis simplex TaxID=6269 RepID=A0A0M3JY79_ANISI|nr:unnamed protein product [Anisakis simplex]
MREHLLAALSQQGLYLALIISRILPVSSALGYGYGFPYASFGNNCGRCNRASTCRPFGGGMLGSGSCNMMTGSALYNGYGSLGINSGYMSGMSSPIGTSLLPTAFNSCQDQSTQCAIWASTGQCASGAEYIRRVCPQSCGTGCLRGTFGNYGSLSSGYGVGSGYDLYGMGSGLSSDALLNPLLNNAGAGYQTEGLMGHPYGMNSLYRPYGLGSNYGFGSQLGLNAGLGVGLNGYGVGLMDALDNSHGNGYGGGYGMGTAMNPNYGGLSNIGLELGTNLGMYAQNAGYGLYGRNLLNPIGVRRSGIYPYSQKEKKEAVPIKSSDTPKRQPRREEVLSRVAGLQSE